MSTRPDLSVLIVTYNSRPFIHECLTGVADTVRAHTYEVIVVDNASPDDTATHVRTRWPSVSVIDMGLNAGFSRANNRAYAASTGRNVLLLNGDAVVGMGALDALVDFLDAHPRAGVAAPQLLSPDGTDQGTARAFPTPAAAVWGRRSPLTRRFPDHPIARRYLTGRDHTGDEPFEIDWVSGACLMVPRAVAAAVGPLDPEFFMHWEDADWCRRIKTAGYGVWCVPEARVVHAEGGSRSGWPPEQVRHFHRSAYHYYAKHHLTGYRVVLRPMAAAALGTRAGFILARDALRGTTPRGATPRAPLQPTTRARGQQ